MGRPRKRALKASLSIETGKRAMWLIAGDSLILQQKHDRFK